MTQTYKMKHNQQGTIYSLLTVESDGRMTMYFHGTDRSVTQEVTVITEGEWKGWLRSEKGSLWPGLESGRWNKMDDGRCKMEYVRCKMDDVRCKMADVRCETEPITVNHEPLTVNPEPLTVNRQTSSTLKAVGMVAAATVALFVIYETGLLIPLGLIGLATGGILK